LKKRKRHKVKKLMERTTIPTRVFIHGLDSSSQGAKGAFFKEHYPGMLVEDFFGPFAARMAKLTTLLAGREDLLLVGSSYGGLMAAVFACGMAQKMRRLILLAPALNHMPPEMCGQTVLDVPTLLYHGAQDEVVPPGPVYEIAQNLFRDLTYHLVQDDHSLHHTFFTMNWDELLS